MVADKSVRPPSSKLTMPAMESSELLAEMLSIAEFPCNRINLNKKKNEFVVLKK